MSRAGPDPIAELDAAEREAVEGLAPPGDTVEAVLADVQAALDRVVDLDIDLEAPSDLDRVRQALPTEPVRAQLLQAALPQPLRGAIEYVSKSDRQSAYWRRSRDWSTPSALSDAEIRRRHAFIEAAADTRGEEGVVELADGRRISRTAAQIGEQLRDRDFSEDPDSDVDEDAGRRLFRRIVEQAFV